MPQRRPGRNDPCPCGSGKKFKRCCGTTPGEGSGNASEESSVEKTRPVPSAHRRLDSAHRLWHRALEEYEDPDGFRTSLNATIQELRNVTFVLQSEKEGVPDFDRWYQGWQERLRSDEVMRWLNGARTRIVHQGDLQTHSTVRVGILEGYVEPRITDFEVSPVARTEAIAELFARTAPPEVRQGGVLRVERRWVVKELPAWELLDALAHAYGVLSTLLSEAHSQAGFRYATYRHTPDGKLERELAEHLEGRLPCMVVTADSRSALVELATGQHVELSSTPIPFDERAASVAAANYGVIVDPVAFASMDLFDKAKAISDMAVACLRKDGHHQTFAHLLRGGDPVGFFGVVLRDVEGKLIQSRGLAAEVERTGADGVIFISESWIAPFDPSEPNRRPSECPDRREVLDVIAARSDGEERTFITPFSHRGSEIVTEPTRVSSDSRNYFLEPVREVWRRRATRRTPR